jgi:hypothetical protein
MTLPPNSGIEAIALDGLAQLPLDLVLNTDGAGGGVARDRARRPSLASCPGERGERWSVLHRVDRR